MTEDDSANPLICLLKEAGCLGLTGSDLKRKTGMSDEVFEEESDKLWLQRRLIGSRSDNCCGRGCGFMCVSYMEESHLWRLKDLS